MRWLRLGPLRCKAPLSLLTREGETGESPAPNLMVPHRFRRASALVNRATFLDLRPVLQGSHGIGLCSQARFTNTCWIATFKATK